MKRIITISLLVLIILIVGCQQTQFGYIHCDAETQCPDGMNCWIVEESLPQCFEQNPCDFYCDGECTISGSNPPKISCS